VKLFAPAVAGLAGIAAVGALWELGGRYGALGPSFPPFSRIALFLVAPENRSLLEGAVLRTGLEALAGFACGAAIGMLGAALAYAIPAGAAGLEMLAALVNGVPIVAVGSLCAVIVPPGLNPIAVAALGTFFIVFVAATSGLSASTSADRDLFSVLGAGRWTTFRRLVVPAAIPSLAGGLRAAAPIATVGAIIGEWFSSDRGLGPLLVNAMQNYQTLLLWSAALLGALLSTVAYALLGILQRVALERYRA